MGSQSVVEKQRRSFTKKILTPQLQIIQEKFVDCGGIWKSYTLEELFGKSTRGKRLKGSDRIKGTLPFVTAGEENTGISAYIGNNVEIFSENTITIDMFGSAKYRGYEYGADDHVAVVHTEHLAKAPCQFIAVCINKASYSGKFSYSRNFYAKDADELRVELPVINDKLAFSYMEKVIKALEAERIETLEAYLTVTGLKDYELTDADKEILDKFDGLNNSESRAEQSRAEQSRAEQSRAEQSRAEQSSKLIYMYELFPNIKQGKRLKKDDHIKGELPFVMAGTTNTGIVKRIANKVEKFPKNSITIDIFGNTFYRGYEFGAGDDTGVFWNELLTDKWALLYLQTVIGKYLVGKYDFGHKLRASQTHRFELLLPCVGDTPDYQFMARFIRVVAKLVVRDLVEWTDRKIQVTKEVVERK